MDVIALAKQVEERYRRYLQTTFYFKDPTLRTSFEQALQAGHLSKGPYLEGTPVFKRGLTPRTLFHTLLEAQSDAGLVQAVHGDRPLYQHQEDAIRGVFEGHNVVVATGTGSGKTESFLYPILLHLYQESRAGTLCPGTRALILYPMNALANDQRDRLGEVCARLQAAHAPFEFTFGQYTGETPEDDNDARRRAQDRLKNRLPGELVLRSEMRQTPPHILLTNYSMLEYLLLRPADSPLFDNGMARWWTFLVLDEAHQYRGSRGIEMAMLLRRLKQRLREGGRVESFRCIATSATLTEGDKDRGAVAIFASDLFGEAFAPEDVILGATEPLPEVSTKSLSPEAYQFLSTALQGTNPVTQNRLAALARELDMSLSDSEELPQTIGRLLQSDSRATQLRRRVTGNPTEVQDIADQVFADLPNQERIPALAQLVDVLLLAKDPTSNAPLLSARYHLFLRSLEGAYVSYWPYKQVFLDRKADAGGSAVFEVALCRECGQHYFVGPKEFRGGQLVEAMRDPGNLGFGATFLRPLENNEDTSDEDERDTDGHRQVFHLCIQCGEAGRSKPQCGHVTILRVLKEPSPKDEDRADQMIQCGACGYNAAGRDPVREVVHGTDGPHAVIATTLYQSLPEGRKKVLAFADGRQEAAFFAWYLEDSYKDLLNRNLLLKVAQSLAPYTSEGLSLRDMVTGLRDLFRQSRVFPPAMSDLDLRREAWRQVYREFLTDEARISLEGVGSLRWTIKWPEVFDMPQILSNPPWLFTEQDTLNLFCILLDSMRVDKAVELRSDRGISVNWGDLALQARQMRIRIGDPRSRDVRSWDGKRGRRAGFLAKLLMRQGSGEQEALQQAIEALRKIWEVYGSYDQALPSQDRLLLSVDDARRLNPDWWRLHLTTEDDPIFQCDTCGRLQTISVRGVCVRRHCQGTLQEKRLPDLTPNHYRLLYEEAFPGSLRVEEHTAQLDYEKAREFQEQFKNGSIHVLSCSTTFELGVDLGDLDTVFLRNVPPEVFNYAQRVGRTGRRSGYPGFAITYCRRGPHDLYHFAEPKRMMSGKVRPPVLSLCNEKIITRHVTATALSYFFRDCPERFKTVGNLCQDLTHPSGTADFTAFLQTHRTRLEVSLCAIVPPDMIAPVGLDNGTWIAKIAGDTSRFSDAEAEMASDYHAVSKIEKNARDQRNYRVATWAQKRSDTLSTEDTLSFLSRKAVIPKYGFPVDVVELDTQRVQSSEARDISLQRDLAIAVSEFAPTSKVIANKKEWTSYGLKRVAGKEWDRWWYARCLTHNRFERRLWGNEKQPPPFEKCCERMHPALYIDPKFGFMTGEEKPKEPQGRSSRVFTTRPYFAGFTNREGDQLHFGKLSLTTTSPGYLVVLCEGRRGQGFFVCGQCGAGFRQPENKHKTPYGEQCSGRLQAVSLGHEFVTDVLQLQLHLQPQPPTEPIEFAYALAYALVEGAAEVLEVPSTDLSTTVAYDSQGHSMPPIILYDNVPGGAGLVARLEDEETLRACFETAQKRVDGTCGCGENASCYGCLRNYRNQFAHQYLQRGPVMRYLQEILLNWK